MKQLLVVLIYPAVLLLLVSHVCPMATSQMAAQIDQEAHRCVSAVCALSHRY